MTTPAETDPLETLYGTSDEPESQAALIDLMIHMNAKVMVLLDAGASVRLEALARRYTPAGSQLIAEVYTRRMIQKIFA